MKKFLLFVSVSALLLLVATFFVARSLRDVGSEVLAELEESENVDPLLEVAIESPTPEEAKAAEEAEPVVAEEVKPDSIANRTTERKEWLESITAENASEMLAELEARPDSVEKSVRRRFFFDKWGELDGESAFIAAHVYDSRTASRLISAAAEGWARVDPSIAWEALMQASNNGALPGVNIGSALREIARQDLTYAISLITDLPNGAKQEFAFSALMRGRLNPDSYGKLLEGTMQMEDKALQARLSKTLYQNWSQYDFDQALSSIDQISDPKVSQNALSGLLSTWAQTDGGAAFDYAAKMGDSSASIDVLTDVTKIWLRNVNAVEAEEVMERIAENPHFSELVSALTYELAAANPERTLELVGSISDQRVRSSTEYKVIARWAGNDVLAAESYVNSLTDERRMAGHLPNILRARLAAGMDLEPVVQTLLSFENPEDRARVVKAAQMLVNRSSQTDADALQSFLDLFPEESSSGSDGNPPPSSIVIHKKI